MQLLRNILLTKLLCTLRLDFHVRIMKSNVNNFLSPVKKSAINSSWLWRLPRRSARVFRCGSKRLSENSRIWVRYNTVSSGLSHFKNRPPGQAFPQVSKVFRTEATGAEIPRPLIYSRVSPSSLQSRFRVL